MLVKSLACRARRLIFVDPGHFRPCADQREPALIRGLYQQSGPQGHADRRANHVTITSAIDLISLGSSPFCSVNSQCSKRQTVPSRGLAIIANVFASKFAIIYAANSVFLTYSIW